jgi:hypothetical protein
VSDRMYWDAVCESLSQDDEGANAALTGDEAVRVEGTVMHGGEE